MTQAGISQFIEKPLSVKPPEEVMELSARLEQLQKDKGIIVAVGYMLRYSPAVEVRCSVWCLASVSVSPLAAGTEQSQVWAHFVAVCACRQASGSLCAHLLPLQDKPQS